MTTIIDIHWAVEGGISTLVAQAFAVVITATLVGMLWRRRNEPTARPLLYVAVALFAFVVGNILITADNFPLFGDLGSIRSSVTGACWLVFTLRYTGRSERLEGIVKRALVVLIPLSIILFILKDILLAVYEYQSSLLETILIVLQLPLSATLFVSALLLLIAGLRQKALLLGQGGLLAVSPVLLMITRSLTAPGRLESPIVVPIGIALSASCVIAALARYRVFETLPVSNTASRDQVVESTTESIMLVDRQQRLRDYNKRAAELFDIDESADTEQPLSEIQPALPEPRRLATLDERVRVQIPDGPLLLAGATEVSNDHGQLFGYTVLIEDITKQNTREQRLQLLNQLLVDVAHDRMTAVASDAKRLAEAGEPYRSSMDLGDQIWDTTTDLTTLVARTREIEQALAEETDQRATSTADVSLIVDHVVKDLPASDDSLVSRFSDEQFLATVDKTLVEVATRTLLEDAIGDAGDAVAVEVSRLEPDVIAIRIDVRTAPLADASNVIDELSMQVARLAVNCAGGEVRLDETEHTTTVQLRLPTNTNSAGLVDNEPEQPDAVQS